MSLNLHAIDIGQQRQQFNSAYQALKNHDLETFYQLSVDLKNYPLYFFLRYSYLKPRLGKVHYTEIQEFLRYYGDSGHGKLLRKAWLYQLAHQREWNEFIQAYTPQESTTLQCYYVYARMQTAQQTQLALQDAKRLWLVGKSQPPACNFAFAYLYESSLMNDQLLWQRIRLAMNKGQLSLATSLAKRLNSSEQIGWVRQWQAMHKNPAKMLIEFNEPDEPIVREIVAHGIRRLARKQFEAAHKYWVIYQRQYAFSAQQIGEIQRDLALASAEQNHPLALKWLTAVNKEHLDENISNVRIKTALKRQEWRALADFITELPQAERESTKWRYWYARALEQLDQRDKEGKSAQELLKKLAKERDYYGFLAVSRTGTNYPIHSHPIAATEEEKNQLMKNLSIKSAYELYQLGMQTHARREWEYAINHLSPRQQAIAATLASEWGWHDRALITAAKAGAYDDLEIRFPLPYLVHISSWANIQGLDLAWVYGVTRQESAFMADVRSRAGALGLMQLMPATARWVARKIGIRLKRIRDVLDVDTNVSLGTTYLRQMLDKFDGNYMLATAAYNAGPGRAVQWAKEHGCLPADIWVEMIPFDETREYVRRVLTYTRIFEARLGRKSTPLRISLEAKYCPHGDIKRISQQQKSEIQG